MPTKQETYDRIVAHLRKQGERCTDQVHGKCLYRGPNGTACAAGCLLEDEDYQPAFENLGLVDMDGYNNLDRLEEPPQNILTIIGMKLANRGHSVKLAKDMQRAHDNCLPSEWEEQFQLVAKKHSLTYTPPTEEIGAA